MDISVQAQFLKVLEEKTYRRFGDTKLRRSDFRLICATNKPIDREIKKGAFRTDLYFRINLLTIHIQPLREKMDDFPHMVLRILGSARSPKPEITEEAMRILEKYSWSPGMSGN